MILGSMGDIQPMLNVSKRIAKYSKTIVTIYMNSDVYQKINIKNTLIKSIGVETKQILNQMMSVYNMYSTSILKTLTLGSQLLSQMKMEFAKDNNKYNCVIAQPWIVNFDNLLFDYS